jgi:hypothetical protein
MKHDVKEGPKNGGLLVILECHCRAGRLICEKVLSSHLELHLAREALPAAPGLRGVPPQRGLLNRVVDGSTLG